MEANPLPLSSVAADTVAIRNTLLGTRRTLTLPIGETQWSLQFVEPSADSAPDSDLVARLNFAEHNLWIALCAADTLLQGVVADVADFAALPEQILLGVLDVAFDEAIVDFEDQTGLPLSVAEILPPGTIPETAAAGAAIGLKLTNENGASVTGQLSADAAALQRLADCVSALPAQSGDVTRYPLVAAVEVGRTSLTVSQLAAIETHDVVVIQELVDTEPSAALLRFPAPLPAWQTRIEDGGLRLLRTLRVADIPAGGQLQVSFRRGAFTMTAGEIARLQPDTLLPAHLSDQTVMWLQDTAIAVGEMVAFRGHTGLRITRLLNRDAAVAASTIAPLELGDHEEQTVDDFAPATDTQRAPDSDDVAGQNSIADTEDIV